MRLSDFDYYLPKELIAQYPAKERGQSRLMVLDRKDNKIYHRLFYDLADYLNKDDSIVLNDTKVIPARLVGKNERTGKQTEILLLERAARNTYFILIKPSRKIKDGEKVSFAEGELVGEIIDGREKSGDIKHKPSRWVINFNGRNDVPDLLKKIGLMPLPPYIKRTPDESDIDRYQSVYARIEGAIAAPTAGLHFTGNFLDHIASKGINLAYATLHIGYSTFKPITADEIETHKMAPEYFELSEETSCILNETKRKGKKILAIGTTSCRLLETVASTGSPVVKAMRGQTDLFIYPPYQFRFIDCLLTNFHLPKTTLLLLVSAFCGKEFLMQAYQEAIEKRYNFYSYGDAMLIL